MALRELKLSKDSRLCAALSGVFRTRGTVQGTLWAGSIPVRKISATIFKSRPYFVSPRIRSLGPGRLIRFTSANPASFIQRAYSASL